MINWNVDPTFITVFGRDIRWYGVLFAVGLVLLGPMIEERIWKREKLPEKWLSKMAIYIFICTVVGARLGHVLFYDPSYYFAHPIKILAIHEGGLASHGGTIGILVGMWIYAKRVTHKGFIWGLDRLAVPVGLIAAMIRIGNLMNSEIFGRITNLPWGFRFLQSQEYWQVIGRKYTPSIDINTLPAVHPTQIYEALAYLAVFAVCMWLYFKRHITDRYNGMIVGVFLVGIFTSRFFIEMVKIVQEPWEVSMQHSIGMNMGQLLSIPFIILGFYFIYYAKVHAKPAASTPTNATI